MSENNVFISYASPDITYARRLYEGLRVNGIDAWFAPVSVRDGDDFAASIGEALDETGDTGEVSDEEIDDVELEKRTAELAERGIFIFLLSKYSMGSVWCPKELKRAISTKKRIHVLQLDHWPLTQAFSFMLSDIQIVPAYRLPDRVAKETIETVRKEAGVSRNGGGAFAERPIFGSDLHITQITHGDPSYSEGETLFMTLSDQVFLLRPPYERLTATERAGLDAIGNFADRDIVLDTSIAEIAEASGITDLAERIEASRLKIARDFASRGNGCYFNNKKYGINDINPYARTVDLGEVPLLKMELFTTDYYTHRVMKDVCKTLYAEKNSFFRRITFSRVRAFRILLTSLGINLLLVDTNKGVSERTVLTRRSVNSAETYNKVRYSLSVIEGVSLSDYDPYRRTVTLNTAVERGLQEELGVMPEMLAKDSIQFYDLFINEENLEIGVSCTVRLRDGMNIDDVLRLHGKDEELEVADKLVVRIDELDGFLRRHAEDFLTQAAYTVGTVLNALGKSVLVYSRNTFGREEEFFHGKRYDGLCGDLIFRNDNFRAVIDGCTPLDDRKWEGLPADVFVARFLGEKLGGLPADIEPAEAMLRLNSALGEYIDTHGGRELAREEKPQANIMVYSVKRREVWCFGDCICSVNGVGYGQRKNADVLIAMLRSFYISTELASGKTKEELVLRDLGSEFVRPLIARRMLFANSDGRFGYPVLNGESIIEKQINVIKLKLGDHVVFATGYPRLFDTLEESERYFAQTLEKDPLGINIENIVNRYRLSEHSYDDRCYLSFIVRA